jgi:hypothetical protein
VSEAATRESRNITLDSDEKTARSDPPTPGITDACPKAGDGGRIS